MDYAAKEWDLHQQLLAKDFEQVHWRAARHIIQDISRITSASGLVSELDLRPLGERRASAKAMMIHENFIDLQAREGTTEPNTN